VIAKNIMNTMTDVGVSAMSAMLEAQRTMIGSRTVRTPSDPSLIHERNGDREEIAAMPPAAEMLARSQPNS